VLNGDRGLVVDAVLTTSDEVSVVFSFTRSYFLLDVDNPGEVVDFLKTVMPRKPLGELYTSLGHFKHGKTVFYRELRRHLAASPERFLTAPGERGLVMIVFTLDGFDAVFKVIRDQPGYPKHTNRREVMERYRLVFRSDRVGRLVDAAEFEHVTFERSRFAPDLLEELERGAPGVVSVRGDEVEIHQLYIERRLTPLNLWVAGQPDDRVRDAVIDYGQAIRELAAADIFPGDLMIKNFGVTRHGRVVFYDYDELCATTECLFRRLPPARDLDDEMAPEPWFAVGPDDVFPEEFPRFLGLPERWRQVLLDTHPDLFTAEFWQSMQAQHRQGVLQDVFPYRAGRRLQRR
jgi:isocitrate dehydrogenase kinase/phosphatase